MQPNQFSTNILQQVFNQSIQGYCNNSAFGGDVHTSINFGQKQFGSVNISKAQMKQMNPLGAGRQWSKVEKDIVNTFTDFTKEYIRQIDLHFKTFNKHLIKGSVDLTVQQNTAMKQANSAQQLEKKKQYQDFVAREEVTFWQDFPRNKKFYHSYLRKLYTLFNQCKMPDALLQDNFDDLGDLRKPKNEEQAKMQKKQQRLAAQQKAYIRDIQLILSLCLDLMPQASQNYTERIESPQPLSSLIQNVWELTDYYTQTVLSNESQDSREIREHVGENQHQEQNQNESAEAKQKAQNKSNNTTNSHSYGEAILSGGNIMSFIGGLGGLEGLKASGIDMSMDKEARHLRKYLYQNRRKFDNVTEELKMFDADNLKNWLILGNLMTIMASDVIQIFLSTQENLKISLGLVEALMTYSNFFSKQFRTIEQDYEALSAGTKTIFDIQQNHIQYQWAQIFGQISKLSTVTFDNCLSFINQALINDHQMKKSDELDDLAEQIFHGRFLHIQPHIVDPNLLEQSPSYKHQVQQQQASQSKKATKVINLFNEILNYLNSSNTEQKFKIVLLKTLRHLIASLNFRDPVLLNYNSELKSIWQKAVQNVFQYVDKIMISKVFPGVGSINLNKKVSSSHWDHLLESPFNQHILLLIIQIIKISEESFYQEALLRLMNWICLPQMLENKKTFDLASRILMEICTPELYKVQEFMHWQPKILNHIYFLKDSDKDFSTPIVSHIDLQVFNQMPHRSPSLLNHNVDDYGGSFSKYRISFRNTYSILFDAKFTDQPSNSKSSSTSKSMFTGATFSQLHKQYLDLMAIYDLEFFQERVIPELILNIDQDTPFSQDLVLLGLTQAHKVLDPSLNFKQKFMTIHQQISDMMQDESYLLVQTRLFEQSMQRLSNFIDNALILIVQSPIFSSKFIKDTFDFFKSSQYKELCSDTLGVIWPSPSLSLIKESEYVSKFLKKTGFAEYLIEINQSSVTFEDHVEIMSNHFENRDAFDPYVALANVPAQEEEGDDGDQVDDHYQEAIHGRYDDFFIIPNEQYDRSKDDDRHEPSRKQPPEYIINDMNKTIASVDKELGRLWDKKKENFARHRLMAFLLEDRANSNPKQNKSENAKKKTDATTESWLNDAFLIKDKQNSVIYGTHPCPKRQLQLRMRTQILQMLHYLPNVWQSQFLAQPLCRNLMLNEKEEIQELTDQTQSIHQQLNLRSQEYALTYQDVDDHNQPVIDQLTVKLQNVSYAYSTDVSQRDLGSYGSGQLLGGTLRLTKQQSRNYERLQNVQSNILAYGILSADFDISSKTSKLLQKMMIFGNLETKVYVLDQIIYMIKELLIEQFEDYHLQMLLQQLVSCVKLWHHTEIHKLRISPNILGEQLSSVQFININSSRNAQKASKGQKSDNSAIKGAENVQTYPEIHSYLYIFDLMDAISLIGISNKEKIARNLSLVLIQESSKLKRLVAGQDKRKSLADLLYYNDLAIRDRIAERMTLIKMFKFKGVKSENSQSCDTFTKTYDRNEVGQVISNLSFFKIIEDNFDYKQAKINESFARDVAVQYVGELATLWKSEFKNLAQSKKQNLKDSQFNKLKRQHRIMGQKIINFIFNLSRRAILIFENKMDAFKNREGTQQLEAHRMPQGPRASILNRKPTAHSKLVSSQKDFVGMNILMALTLYNITISSYNQFEMFYEEIEEGSDHKDGDEDSDQEHYQEAQANSSQGSGQLDLEDNDEDHKDGYQISEAQESAKMKKQKNKDGDGLKSFKLTDLQDDLFNIIQLVNYDPSDFQKSPPGSFFPSKIPISSVLLCFQFLIQSPLPLALSNKRAQLAREQANQLRLQNKRLSSKQNVRADSKGEAKVLESNVSSKKDILEILKLQIQNLKDIFNNDLKEDSDTQYLLNSILCHCLLFVCSDSIDGDSVQTELQYLVNKQSLEQNCQLIEMQGILVDISVKILKEQRQYQALEVIKAVLYNGICKVLRIIMDQKQQGYTKQQTCFEDYLALSRQKEIVSFCQRNSLSATAIHDWLLHKNRQSYQIILQYQHMLSQNISQRKEKMLSAVISPGTPNYSLSMSNQIQLDLQYMISMQNLGYDVLKYFKLSQNNAQKIGMSTKEQMVHGVNEIKMLINSVYQYYTFQEDINELLQNANPFYECFLDQIISSGNEAEQHKFLKLLQENRFKQAYEKLTKACFNLKYEEDAKSSSKRILIDTQVKKFVQYNIHCKYFLLTLSMSLNLRSNGEPAQISQIERSRLICLATLPLMFDDEEFREQVEEKISNMPDLSQLLQFDNKDFYRLIKMIIKDEDSYNLQNHFEKYFAISGFVRNLLNEIIKLQAQNDSKIYSSNLMIIKILDTLTYFMTMKGGSGLQLRRAPRNTEDQSTFLFDNLIDYKSFEFLSKLFKITEKLIEFDQDMIIMNMWFKLVENQRANYEILAKFLIHNLSSFMIKLKTQAQTQAQKQPTRSNQSQQSQMNINDNAQYNIEFEKQKRYSINIFNYIKARVQRADIRNSIQVSSESPTWAKKMIELLLQAQLNIQSKYVLEKVKLKKILQTMHREINQTGTALKLKGGIDTEILVMQFQNLNQPDDHQNKAFNEMAKQSVRMSQLLESKTFLNTFASSNQKEQSIIDNLLFNFQRIIKEKFVKITPVNQLNQFNELLIKYLENSLIFIANDTDRQLQFIQFTREQELIIVVVMLTLIGHLMMHHNETRYKHLVDIFKTLQANISGLQPFFYLNTLSPRQLQLNQGKNTQSKDKNKHSKFSERMLTMFNYKTTLFDCFDQFTKIFFTVTNNISSDSELRINMMELYQQIFRGLREVQKQKLTNQHQDEDKEQPVSRAGQNLGGQRLAQSVSIVQGGKKLRSTILAIMQSAYFNLHELASVQNKLVQLNQSQASYNAQSHSQQTSAQLENKQVYNLSKNFRQHISSMIDYILDSYQLDRLRLKEQAQAQAQQQRKAQPSVITNTNDIMARDMSAATRQILFASNTLFWVGIACLEAPHHIINQIEDTQPNTFMNNPYLIQIQQIQYIGMLAVRRTLEETNFVKILIVFQKLSDLFYSYNLQMESRRQSFMSILFNSIRNPLCTRDALKTLILSIRIQDSKLLVGENQQNLDETLSRDTMDDKRDDSAAADQNLKQAVGKVELIRLLYLLPYFMQQFLASSANQQASMQDQLFQNKKNMIQLLKKSLPSIGINKKSDIFERLEVIQRKTANQHFERIDDEEQKQEYRELSQEFESLIKQTIDLIYQQGFKGSLMDCFTTFQRLQKYQLQRFGTESKKQDANHKQAKEVNDQPIQIEILEMMIAYLGEIFKEEDQASLIKSIEDKKLSHSIFNQSSEILGEEVDNYRVEFRALYFGIKNIILREIEYTDKDIEVSQFFDQDANPNPSSHHQGSTRLSASKKKGSTKKGFGTAMSQSGQNQRFSMIQRQGAAAAATASGQAGTQNWSSLNQNQYHPQNAQTLTRISEPNVEQSQKLDIEVQQLNRQLTVPSSSVHDQIKANQLSRDILNVGERDASGAFNGLSSIPDQVKPTHNSLNKQPAQGTAQQEIDQVLSYKVSSGESAEIGREVKKSQYSTISARQGAPQAHEDAARGRRSENQSSPGTGRAPQRASVKSKSKSRTRYVENEQEDEGDEQVQIDDAPKISQVRPLFKRTLEQQQDPIQEEQEFSQRSFADLTKEQQSILQSHQSKKVDHLEERKVMDPNRNVFQPAEYTSHHVQNEDTDMMTFQRRAPKHQSNTISHVQNEAEPILELPDSQFGGETDVLQNDLQNVQNLRRHTQKDIPFKHQGLVEQARPEAEHDPDLELSSQDRRRFYQAPIDPTDNQSQQTFQSRRQDQAAFELPGPHRQPRPQTSNVFPAQPNYIRPGDVDMARYQEFLMAEQEREQQAQQMRPQTAQIMQQQKVGSQGYHQSNQQMHQQPQPYRSQVQQQLQHHHPRRAEIAQSHLPAALQPNFVAQKSNQIWSDVASQKSQAYQNHSLMQQSHPNAVHNPKQQPRDQEYYRQQNQQTNPRNMPQHVDDRQSAASFKSFTQISEHQRYNKNEPNFDFSSDEIQKRK